MNYHKTIQTTFFLLVLICASATNLVFSNLYADEGESLVTGNGIPGTSLNQSPKADWNSMSDSEKQKIRERWKQFKAMNANERNELKTKFEKFKSMSPEKRQQMVKTFERFKSFPENRQQAIRKRFEQFKNLSPDEKKKRIQALREHRRAMGKGPNGPGGKGSNGNGTNADGNKMGGPIPGAQDGPGNFQGQNPGQTPGQNPGMKRNQFNRPGMQVPFQDGQHRPRPRNQRNQRN